MSAMRIAGGLGLVVGLGLAAGPGFALEGDADRGERVAGTCTACHQADGMGMAMPQGESWPRLAGLPAAYIAKQLHDFKAGRRENATMMPFANMLDDQQIVDVAAYYAQLAPWPSLPDDYRAADPGKSAEWLAERGDWSRTVPGCNQCHGPNGQGVGSHFPPLAGQHAGYLAAQLEGWREGRRRNDPNGLMRGVAERLSDDEIASIADYYATLPERLAASGAPLTGEDAQ
ncbi:c-type cytochrome [Halomonas organivorans]|uniref:Cytochrome c553 n=1 Tax=Halomonas organivorans TaxID=257772 RepID=A0A7W5BZN0_9GAMM|nr:c-type cytochrome [Halomonas organivorans]MBB3142092.1 cytochrome c553 [Halomonas organivorans]